MYLRKLLSESYYEGLYHLSKNPNLSKENLEDSGPIKGYLPDKPYGGFWVAKGLSWLRWGIENDFIDDLENLYLYRVKINPKAKILDLKEVENNFNLVPAGKSNYEKYVRKISGSIGDLTLNKINFEKVKKDYDGVRAYNFIRSSYDVPSVVVFNNNIIESVDYAGNALDVAEKANMFKQS